MNPKSLVTFLLISLLAATGCAAGEGRAVGPLEPSAMTAVRPIVEARPLPTAKLRDLARDQREPKGVLSSNRVPSPVRSATRRF